MNDLFITMAISVILSTVKNPESKAKLRKAMLKVFTTIKAQYASDPDFQ